MLVEKERKSVSHDYLADCTRVRLLQLVTDKGDDYMDSTSSLLGIVQGGLVRGPGLWHARLMAAWLDALEGEACYRKLSLTRNHSDRLV